MRTLLKALFGLLLVASLLWRFDFHAVMTALLRYRWPWLLAALSLMSLSWLLAAVRWKLFATRFSYVRLLELTLIGQFYAVVLPGQLAGEVVKAWRLARGNVDAERLAATVLIDRIIGTLSLVLVASTGLMLSQHSLPPALAAVFFGLALLLITCVLALNAGPVHSTAVRVSVWLERTRLKRFALSLHRGIDAWHGFGKSPSRLIASMLIGVAFQLLGVLIFRTLGSNLGIDLPLVDWAWIFGTVSIAVLIPVSIGGIGLREGALVGCLGFLGITGGNAIALSFGVFAITLSGAVAGGIVELAETTHRQAAKSRGTQRR